MDYGVNPFSRFWFTFDDDSEIMCEAEMSNRYRSRLVHIYPTISYPESSKVSQNRSQGCSPLFPQSTTSFKNN